MTTFESLEALWEDDYRVWKPTRGAQEQNPYTHSNGSSPKDIEPVSRTSVEVDEALLSSQELSTLEEQGDAPVDTESGAAIDAKRLLLPVVGGGSGGRGREDERLRV